MSQMRPEDMRKLIRFATNDNKTPTDERYFQRKFLKDLDLKIKTENPHIRIIHEETIPVAEEKINWTSKTSKLPRGVIVIVHTHGEFEKSHDLIKYPTDVNNTLESVSSLYLSDIGNTACNTRTDYQKFDNEFIRSFPLVDGISIKDISEKVQEISNKSKLGLKRPNLNKKDPRESILERYFESGVYNLAVSTKTNNIPYLNKSYSCGPKDSAYPYHSIQVVDYGDFVYLLPKTYGLRPLSDYNPNFDCHTADSSITTFELVNELSKAIPNLKHVLIIDTSCSVFRHSIIKTLFEDMTPDSTPHRHREKGLLKKIEWNKVKDKHKYYQKIQTQLEKILSKPLFTSGGGKKTKKRQHNRRYKKTKKS